MPAMYLGMAFGVCFTFFWSLLVSIPVGQARDEQVIQQVSGKLHQHLEPFTVTDDWELRWDYKGDVGNDLFQLVLQSSPADVPVDLVTQKGSGQGTKRQRKGGTYYLKVISMGKWTVTVVQFR
jgi:hypothetical protein